MLRVLAWKEWREQRSVVFAGMALAAAMPLLLAATSPIRGDEGTVYLVELLPVVLAAGVWPLFAAATGASTISNETGDGTLRFLLSRPVSRIQVWGIKVGTAILATTAIAVWSFVVARLFARWALGPEHGITFDQLLRGFGSAIVDPLSLATISLLLLACSVLFSTFVSRPLTAAAGGFALALMILTTIFFFWSRISRSTMLAPRIESHWLAIEVAVTATMVLVASLLLFARSEVLFGKGIGRAVGTSAGFLLGGVVVGALPAVFASGSLTPETAVVPTRAVSVSTFGVAMGVHSADGSLNEVWLVRGDGSGMINLTGRHSYSPSFNGRSVAYFSRRGIGATVRDGYDLRIVQPSGANDRLLIGDLTEPYPVYARGSTRFALFAGSDLYVVSERRERVVRRDLAGTELEAANLLGWTTNRQFEALVFEKRVVVAGDDQLILLLYEVESGEVEEIGRSDVIAADRFVPRQPGRGWRFYPLRTLVSDSPDSGQSGELINVELLDILTEETLPLGETTCFDADFEQGGEWLIAYLTCGDQEDPGAGTLHVRDIYEVLEEQELLSARITDVANVDLVEVSSVGSQVLLYRQSPGGDPTTFVISADSPARSFPRGWYPLGWAGPGRAILADSLETLRTMAAADTLNGNLQVIYP